MRGRESGTHEALPAAVVSEILVEVGKKLADRWLNLLVLPGVLWLAALAAAARLGQQHAFDIARLYAWLNAEAAQRGSHDLAAVVLAAAGLLAAAGAIGMAAAGLGATIQRAWVLPGSRPPLSWLVAARQHRWDKATKEDRAAISIAADPKATDQEQARAVAAVSQAERRRAALGGSRPERPTWIGERFLATAKGIHVAYGLDFELAWPRLWSILPDTLRTDLAAAQDAYAGAARLTAWGPLYVLVAIAWWPAAVIGVVLVIAGWLRSRAAASVLADLIETAADLHTSDLAVKLGIMASTPVTAQTGRDITRLLRKRVPAE